MTGKNGLQRFVNGAAPALIKHVLGLLGVLGAVIISGTLLYAEMRTNIKNTDDNRTRVEAIEKSINEVTTQQKLLIQRSDMEKEANREFRNKTSDTLDKILDRLPRRERPVR